MLLMLAVSRVLAVALCVVWIPAAALFAGREAACALSAALVLHQLLVAAVSLASPLLASIVRWPSLAALLFIRGSFSAAASTVFAWTITVCGPVFAAVEAYNVGLLAFQASRAMTSSIHERPTATKAAVLSVALAGYSLAIWFFYGVFIHDDLSIYAASFASIAGTLTVVLFFVSLVKEEGVITDMAFIAVYLGHIARLLLLKPNVLPPKSLGSSSGISSAMSVLSVVREKGLGRAIAAGISPKAGADSAAAFGLRVLSTLWFGRLISSWFAKEEGGSGSGALNGALLTSLGIVSYTHAILLHLSKVTVGFPALSLGPASLNVPIMQLCVCMGTYLRLLLVNDEDENLKTE